jgi:hypothetical protein
VQRRRSIRTERSRCANGGGGVRHRLVRATRRPPGRGPLHEHCVTRCVHVSRGLRSRQRLEPLGTPVRYVHNDHTGPGHHDDQPSSDEFHHDEYAVAYDNLSLHVDDHDRAAVHDHVVVQSEHRGGGLER